MSEHIPDLPDHPPTTDVSDPAVFRSVEWLAAQAAALPSGPAVGGYAVALATVCTCLGNSPQARDLHYRMLAHSDAADWVYVDPITAIFLTGVSEGSVSVSEESLRHLLAGTASEARQAVTLIEMATRYGSHPIILREPYGEILQGMALAAARNRDLIFALRCARASAYISEIAPIFRDTIINLIRFGQGIDGSFVHDAALAPQSRSSPALAFVLRCAVGIQALWTLQEFTRPDERLIGLFGSTGASSVRTDLLFRTKPLQTPQSFTASSCTPA